jgi:MFS family permease
VEGGADLTRDQALLFAARALRLFAYGGVSVVLVLHLDALGHGEARIGALLTLALAGDTLVSLALATRADRLGRRWTLAFGAALLAAAGVAFATAESFAVLAVAATLGILSPTGGEVGPFLAIEQAALAQTLPDRRRTDAFAWYHLTGALGAALGALAAGLACEALQAGGVPAAASHRAVLLAYAGIGVALALLFVRLSPAVEVRAGAAAEGGAAAARSGASEAAEGGAAAARIGARAARRAPAEAPRAAAPAASSARADRLGLGRSRPIVLRLSALFALDAFGGGFIVQSLLAWWLARRFGASEGALGALFFASNALAALSALGAAAIARRIGLVRTMVFTHLPANLILLAVPFAPGFAAAAALWLARSCVSQMDVPTRQSYTMAVVAPEERAAAAGVTGVARTLGAAAAPLVAGVLLERAMLAAPFFAAGGLKIAYDLLLLAAFRRVRPPEEVRSGSGGTT